MKCMTGQVKARKNPSTTLSVTLTWNIGVPNGTYGRGNNRRHVLRVISA